MKRRDELPIIARNLATGEERAYMLPPILALIAAVSQSRGNYNTWTYPKMLSDLGTPHYGNLTVSLDDWCVFIA